MKGYDSNFFTENRSIFYYLAQYLTAAFLILWTINFLGIVNVRRLITWDVFLWIVVLVDVGALIIAAKEVDIANRIRSRTLRSIVEHLVTDIYGNRELVYTTARNLLLLSVGTWLLAIFQNHIFRLALKINHIFYLNVGVGIGALAAYLKWEKEIDEWITIFRLIFVVLLGLVLLVGVKLPGESFDSLNRTPIYIITSLVGIIAIYYSSREPISDPEQESLHSSHFDIIASQGSSIVTIFERAAKAKIRYAVMLGALFVVGIAIRLHDLALLPPYPDEYYHLVAAREMVWNDGVVQTPSYTRAYWVVTVPVYVSFLFLDSNLFAARLVMVLFSVLSIVPLYFLLKRINRSIAFIACVLYISNPWIIAVSRTVREYAVIPFYMLSLALFLVVVLDRLPIDFSTRTVLQENNISSIILILFGLFFPIFYIAIVDPLSTFRQLLGFYVISFGIFIYRIDKSDRTIRLFLLGVTLLAAIGIIYTFYSQSFLSLVPTFGDFAIHLFIDDPEQQWYYNRSFGLVLLILIFGFACLLMSRTHVGIFCLAAFIGFYYVFEFHFARYTRPRYAYHIEIWFLTVVAAGVWFLSRHISSTVRSYYPMNLVHRSIIVLILLVGIINPAQIVLAVNLHENYQGTYTPITIEHHIDAGQRLDIIDKYVDEIDVILIHRPIHLKWHNPSIYNKVEVRQYRCNDGSRRDYSSALRDIDRNNVMLITDWRSNRNQCISSHPLLSDFVQIDRSDDLYTIFTNFDDEDD